MANWGDNNPDNFGEDEEGYFAILICSTHRVRFVLNSEKNGLVCPLCKPNQVNRGPARPNN